MPKRQNLKGIWSTESWEMCVEFEGNRKLEEKSMESLK